jgi:anaerobic ribonucleoside-triphosphate reductase
MKTQTLPAHEVRAGMHILLAGCVYEVESNWFDRHGKAHFEPLNIIVCNLPRYAREAHNNDEHFGLLPSRRVTVILEPQALI